MSRSKDCEIRVLKGGARLNIEDAHGIGSIRGEGVNHAYDPFSTRGKELRVAINMCVRYYKMRVRHCHCIFDQRIRGTTPWSIPKASLELKTVVASYGDAINGDTRGGWHVSCVTVGKITKQFVTAGFGPTRNQCA